MKKKREEKHPKMDQVLGPIPVPKSDPSFSSFKSKRYRDKLRTEIKALEQLLPVERTALHRKLDSQTVFRLAIAYFRTKLFLEAAKMGSSAMRSELAAGRQPRSAPHPLDQAGQGQQHMHTPCQQGQGHHVPTSCQVGQGASTQHDHSQQVYMPTPAQQGQGQPAIQSLTLQGQGQSVVHPLTQQGQCQPAIHPSTQQGPRQGVPSTDQFDHSRRQQDTKSGDSRQNQTQQSPKELNLDDLIQGHDLLQAMDGFLLVLTSDGTILFVSRNILHHLGFNQVDLMMRCMYGIVHPDDHQELKMVLEQTLSNNVLKPNNQQRACCVASHSQSTTTCRTISFLCRMKCFNGTTTGYLKMHCIGHMMSFPKVVRSQRTSNHVLFAFCRPFISVSTDSTGDSRNKGFWSKHELDLRFRNMDEKISEILGYTVEELEGKSMYGLLHPEDLAVFRSCHKALTETDEIQTMYFRLQHKDDFWVWLHTRGKVVFKNSKKYSIVFTHCPVREEDSTYIQQEVILRQRYALHELINGKQEPIITSQPSHSEGGVSFCGVTASQKANIYGSVKDESSTTSLHDPHGQCPSSWHTSADRHSPVFPNNHLPHPSYKKDKTPDCVGTASKLRKTRPGGQMKDLSWCSNAPGYEAYSYPEAPLDPYSRDPCIYHGSDPPGYPVSSVGHPANPRQYHMHINGVGYGPYTVPCPVQCSSTTVVFEGRVTAIEAATSEQRSLTDGSNNQPCQGHFPNNAVYGPCPYWSPDGANVYPHAVEYGTNNNYLAQKPLETWERCKVMFDHPQNTQTAAQPSDWRGQPGQTHLAHPHGTTPECSELGVKEEQGNNTLRTSIPSTHPKRYYPPYSSDIHRELSEWCPPTTMAPVACAENAIYGNGGAAYMQIAEGVTISTTRSIQKSETYIAL